MVVNNRISEKVQWLLAHQDLWVDRDTEGLYMRDRQAYNRIVDGMKVAGLVSHNTSNIDVHLSVLIEKARALKAEGK